MENRIENGHAFDLHDDSRDPLDPYRDFADDTLDPDWDDTDYSDISDNETFSWDDGIDEEAAWLAIDEEVQAEMDEQKFISHGSREGMSGHKIAVLTLPECYVQSTQRAGKYSKILRERRKPRHIRRGKRDRVKWEQELFSLWETRDTFYIWVNDRVQKVSEKVWLQSQELPWCEREDMSEYDVPHWEMSHLIEYDPEFAWDINGGTRRSSFEELEERYRPDPPTPFDDDVWDDLSDLGDRDDDFIPILEDWDD